MSSEARSDAAGPAKIARGEVWKLLGAPHEQVGSVNDPRTFEDHGVKWNEKWVYLDESGERVERLVFWYRYDFLGVFRIGEDGGAEPEPLPDA